MSFNPRTPRGVRRQAAGARRCRASFNPRTPRGVRRPIWVGVTSRCVSIHAPRAGCDCWPCLRIRSDSVFQSTHPARGATLAPQVAITSCFNPRTPRGVRLGRGRYRRDSKWFQSTHPARGATMAFRSALPRTCFNPRTPRGVRLLETYAIAYLSVFQSTHPARGATGRLRPYWTPTCVSIHAPRAGCDVILSLVYLPACVFQSTHPARGATQPTYGRRHGRESVSIHAPRAGCDASITRLCDNSTGFNPRTPRGVRHRWTQRRITPL